MFADDTNITARGCTLAKLEHHCNSELINLSVGNAANNLSQLKHREN